MTDYQKLEKFVNILPEERIRNFASEASWGELSGQDLEMFVLYDEYNSNISAQFSNQGVQKSFSKFNDFFEDFIDFYESQLRSETKSGKLMVDRDQYQELQDWANRLYDQYIVFLDDANKILSNEVIKDKSQSIEYNVVTGIGYAGGERFKFKDHQPEFRLFRELYKGKNSAVPREEVLKIIGVEAQSKTGSYIINDVVKKIRKVTGLNKDQVVNNNGNITLVT